VKKRVVASVAAVAVALTAASVIATTNRPSVVSATQSTQTVASATFTGNITSWTPYGNSVISYSSQGHSAAGSLQTTSPGGGWSGAVSPKFSVTSGLRYTASGWGGSSTGAHSVGLAEQFFNSSGQVISSATQVGQGEPDNGWTNLAPVVGFAPTGAVSMDVVVLNFDSAQETDYFDDLSVTATSGTSVALVGPLTTNGTTVKDSNGTVTFRGINLDGLEYSPTASLLNSVSQAKSWGANFVRIPLAENYAMSGDCLYNANYLSTVDALVQAATSKGMVALLDLHTYSATACASPVQHPAPDTLSTSFWNLIANRYKANSLVAFDLYNEPHNLTDAQWHTAMQGLYNTVRATGAANLIVVSGNNWANNYPSTAPLVGTNYVYGVHAYTCPTATPANGGTCNPGPGGVYDASNILNNWNNVSCVSFRVRLARSVRRKLHRQDD
jgi:hypothetical protein